MTKPWRILSSEPVVTNPWFALRADRCVTPNGQEISPYYVVTCPDWVHVVALTDDEELILVEQYRHGIGASCLELPGGLVDQSETDPVAAARRELQEETGFVADEWRLVSSLYVNPGRQNNRFHTVLATGCRCVAQPSLDEGEEGLLVHRKPLDAVLRDQAGATALYINHIGALMLGLSAMGRLDVRTR